MIRLNTTQEQYLINYMITNPELFIGSGSSRVVFHCTDELAEYLKLPAQDEKYIVKIAMGQGGIEQMRVEVETFIEYGDTGAFAEIAAVGRYVEIMEYVETADFFEAADENWGPAAIQDEYEVSKLEADSIFDTIETLEGIFGHTADNGQLGKTLNDYWVAYDYGFIPGKGFDSQSSTVSFFIGDTESREEYLTGLIHLLDEEKDFMWKWENTFLDKKRDQSTISP